MNTNNAQKTTGSFKLPSFTYFFTHYLLAQREERSEYAGDFFNRRVGREYATISVSTHSTT